MKLIRFLTISLLIFPLLSFGQDQHPIDVELDSCTVQLDDPWGYDAGICYAEAHRRWDKELNKNYKRLMTTLESEGQANLKASQREWIKYRDLEFEFITGILYDEEQGTMYKRMAALEMYLFVKARAEELGSYLKLIEESDQWSTSGIDEVDAADKELNKNYKRLIDILGAEGKTALKVSQRQWIKYRDKEFGFQSKILPKGGFDKYKGAFIRSRAADFDSYIEDIEAEL